MTFHFGRIFQKKQFMKREGGIFSPTNILALPLMIGAGYVENTLCMWYSAQEAPLSHLPCQNVVTFRISLYIKALSLAS